MIEIKETKQCTTCGTNVRYMKDSLSVKEFDISGMCQKCQDSVFGVKRESNTSDTPANLIKIKISDSIPNIKRAYNYFHPLFANIKGNDLYPFQEELEEPAITDFWIAGGCLRDFFEHGHVKSDVDVFTNSSNSVKILVKTLVGLSDSEPVFESNNVSKFEGVKCFKDFNPHTSVTKYVSYPQVDVVKRLFKSPEATINEFDFTVSQFAMTSTHFYCTQEALFDLISKKLTINKTPMPVATMKRVPKYLKKGFTLCQGTMMDLAKSCTNLKEEDLKDIDQFYFD